MRKFSKTSEVINESIFNDYVYASKLFNDKYKNEYRIDLFLDFNFLTIILRNLKKEISYKVQILNSEINKLDIDNILNAYEELIRKVVE